MRQTVAQFMNRTDHVSVIGPAVTLPLPNTLMGVEVEVDNDGSHSDIEMPENYSPEWTRKGDGSLVNGWEYVLSAPLKGQGLTDAIHKLYSGGTNVRRTYTGSTHIHINMLDGVDMDALRAMVLLAYAFESLLYYVGDNTRQWCGYANRLISAPAEVLESIIVPTASNSLFRNSVDRAGRYYGLNLQALQRYGTVEFRYFPTAESAEELISWVKLVQSFKKAALEVGSIEALINTLSTKEGYNDFVSNYFADHVDDVLVVCEYKKVKALMAKALIIATATKPDTVQPWDRAALESRFSKLIATRAAGKGFKFQLHTTPASRTAPVAHVLAEQDRAEHGVDVHTLLAHNNGALYTAQAVEWSQRLEWVNIADLASYNLAALEEITNNQVAIVEAINNLALNANTTRVLHDSLRYGASLVAEYSYAQVIPSDDPEPEENDDVFPETYDDDDGEDY